MNIVNNRAEKWLHCPFCQTRTKVKINPETVLINFPLYCPKFRNITTINIVSNKMLVVREPDA